MGKSALASSDVQRKLTAILCADVAGYSRLMGENEKATLRALTDYRQVFSVNIEKFRGRIVDAPGDSILAKFGSLVDAVGGVAEIQREQVERNAEMLDDRRMQYRTAPNRSCYGKFEESQVYFISQKGSAYPGSTARGWADDRPVHEAESRCFLHRQDSQQSHA